jgi:hypothetical protein
MLRQLALGILGKAAVEHIAPRKHVGCTAHDGFVTNAKGPTPPPGRRASYPLKFRASGVYA